MKTFQLIAICLTTYVCNAQVVEHFSDGNFTADPVWSGSTAHFVVNASQQLQLNNTIAGTSYLSTPFSASSLDGFEWQILVKQSFAPSGSNFARVYLVSDSDNLAGPLNGYYLQLGEAGTADAVELFRQSGTSHVSICRGANAMIAAAFSIRIKVTRTVDALWTMSIDTAGGSAFAAVAQGTDAAISVSSFAGVVCTYTSGNATKFYFDDLLAGPPIGDVTPPEITAAEIEGDSSVRLHFSEALDTSTISKELFMGSDELGIPVSVEVGEALISVKLSFASAFSNGKLYRLGIDSAVDVSGNVMPATTISFRRFVPDPASRSDVIFNELFPDPSPIVGLPGHEFLELYNRSEKAFHLEGWTIADATSQAVLPSHYLLPGEYLVITSTSGAPFYTANGATLGLANMPTLNNASDNFSLRDSSGLMIDSVSYSASWYRDDDRALGGYTLERLQPSAGTNEHLNWIASEAITGGTPAAANSVLGRKLDSVPPAIDSLVVLSNQELIIVFNEEMDSASLEAGVYGLETMATPITVNVMSRAVLLKFESPFQNGYESILAIEGVMDTAQNVMPPTQMPFRYFIPGHPDKGDVVINEIMADPSPVVQLPEAEYVELINNSGEVFNLNGWTLCDATACAVLGSRIIVPGEFLLLVSTTNASKFESSSVLGVVGFPSLSNSGEPLVIRSDNGQLIDSLSYELAWFGDDLKRDGGWSLERLLLEYPSISGLNWRPARDSSGGTPGRTNSIVGDKLDARPPSIDSLVVSGPNQLRVYFNERMDLASLSDPLSFYIQGEHASVVVPSENSVTLAFVAPFLNGHSNHLRIDSLADVAGNWMEPIELAFRYFIPGTPAFGDVVLNEIMADPAPVVYLPEAEYVELFNNSVEPFDLEGWTLADASATSMLPHEVLLPGDFLILTSPANASKFEVMAKVLAVPGFPSLNNTGEPLVIRSRGGVLLDSVRYDLTWLGDNPKQDGGWSLERLLYNYASTSFMNWRPATDSSGGTPGRPNSILGEKLDPEPPSVDSVNVVDSSRLRLYFSESMDPLSLAQPGSYVIVESGETPASTMVSDSSVTLTFALPFKNGVQLSISVNEVTDTAGNEISHAQLPFRHFVPAPADNGVILINEIMADPTPVVRLPEAEFIELFNHGADPFDLHGWTLADGADSTVLPHTFILPGHFLVLTASSSAAKFDSTISVLGVVNFPSLSNTGEPLVLRSGDGTMIDSVRYAIQWLGEGEKRDGGWSLERLLYDHSSNSSMNWRPASDLSGGTPGRPNSILGERLDPILPSIDSVEVLDSTSLRVYFTESMDSVSLGRVEYYVLESSGEHPVDALASDSFATLTFALPFTNGMCQSLSVDSVLDEAGNAMLPVRLPFLYFAPVSSAPGVILINEIMADPSPVVGLPEAEFIEIFNHSDDPFDLSGWTIADGADTTMLSSILILPGEFIVLTASSSAPGYDSTISVLGVHNFPSLSNTGESLVLRDQDGTIIDSVKYAIQWFGEGEKREGGWSLERVRHNYSSTSSMNWRPSIDGAGGTPGKVNSVFGERVDIISPAVDSLVVVGNSRLQIYFNERMDSLMLLQCQFYTLMPGGEKPLAAKASRNLVELNFLPFSNGTEYKLLIDGVADSSGNVMPPADIGIMYFVPGIKKPGVIIFNEILADPAPAVGLPEAEFIELFNSSDEPYDLFGWTLADGGTQAVLPTCIVRPGAHLILTAPVNTGKFDGAVLGVPSFPSLSNSGESIVLRSPEQITIDSTRYDIAWYGQDLKHDGGWSLERLLPLYPSAMAENWRPSVDSSGGTPGRQNSIFGHAFDVVHPSIDSVVVIDDHALVLHFSEAVDSISLMNPTSYMIEETQQRPVEIEAAVRSVTLIFDSAFVNGEQRHLAVSGVTDISGNAVPAASFPFRHFVPGEIVPGAVLINEIMADPSPVVHLPEAEFVEIFNRSDKPFDLKGWTLSDASSSVQLPSFIIMPGDFVAITAAANHSKFSGRVVGVFAFPSLNNAGEPLVLRSSNGAVVDSVRYSVDWFGESPKRDGGWSLERLRYDLNSNWDLNWRVSLDSTGGTPGYVNSRFGQHPDQVAPWLTAAWVENANSIALVFNEPVADPPDLEQVQIDTIACTGFDRIDPQAIRASFAHSFINGQTVTLRLTGLVDTALNRMESMEMTLRYFLPKPVAARDIIITEIMADPSPTVGLPEMEYIELLNRSVHPVNLAGWKLTDAQGSVVLPEAIVQPGEYLVLISSGVITMFETAPRTVSIKGFPSLGNEGEPLVLRNGLGFQIDSLFYTNDWYRSLGKSDGGWSLELIDPFNPCGGIDNWAASESHEGGTPGVVNSINANKPDITGPGLTGLNLLSNTHLRMTFNEQLDRSLAQAVVDLQPEAGAYTLRFADQSLKVLDVLFDEALKKSTEYLLTTDGIFDCNGNRVDAQYASQQFAVPESPHPGDIVINEILFDPFPNGVDFVEIYNQSRRYIDFDGWRFERNGDETNISHTGVVPPLSYRVFTTEPLTLGSHYPQTRSEAIVAVSLPSMPDDSGVVTIKTGDGFVIDSVQYHQNMHSQMLRDVEGVSLERISFEVGSNDPVNWRSANEAAGFATPGYVNSNSRSLFADDQDQIVISPEVIPAQGSVFTLISYNLSSAGNFVTCGIVDQQGRLVRELANNVSVGPEGFFRWDADDENGQRVMPGYYVVRFELFNAEGQVHLSRKRVIVAPR
jgi:hypothetical protein